MEIFGFLDFRGRGYVLIGGMLEVPPLSAFLRKSMWRFSKNVKSSGIQWGFF